MDIDGSVSDEVFQINSRDFSFSGVVCLYLMRKWKEDGKVNYENIVEDNCVLGINLFFQGVFKLI